MESRCCSQSPSLPLPASSLGLGAVPLAALPAALRGPEGQARLALGSPARNFQPVGRAPRVPVCCGQVRPLPAPQSTGSEHLAF